MFVKEHGELYFSIVHLTGELTHELYDHLGLAWEDLLRVGKIRVTVNASYDYMY